MTQPFLPLTARSREESHRAATPLELFFDLCFVVAVAQAGAELVHAVAEGHAGEGIINYAMIFFAIWWAWMNFTWFASAYDNDDVLYRVVTLVQIAGVLILAAGVSRAFEEHDFLVVYIGYVVMRLALASQWLRAAHHATDPAERTMSPAVRGRGRRRADRLARAGPRAGVGPPVGLPRHGARRDLRTPVRGEGRAQHLAPAPHRRAVRPVHHHRPR